jgi:tetratricopeptide (TPR) repeat protein
MVMLVTAGTLFVIHQRKWSDEQAWAMVVPSEYVNSMTQVRELEEKGQFDDAVRLALHSIGGRPSDAFIYQMVAQDYAYREYKIPQQSNAWAELSAAYSEKALNANPDDLSNIFNVGHTYEEAGDSLQTSDSCRFYKKAAELFEQLSPKLQADVATIQGASFRLASFRQHNADELVRVRSQLASCDGRVPTNEPSPNPAIGAAISKMAQYTQQGDYDRAVETGVTALKANPDASILHQLALIHLVMAAKQPLIRDRRVREAILYENKSLQFETQRREFFSLYETGRVMETAGDLSPSGHCEYYLAALKAFADQAPLLTGDYVETHGSRFPLAEFRKENDKSMTKVKGKVAAAGCK